MQLPSRRTPVERCLKASTFTIGALRTYPQVFESPPDVAARLEAIAGILEPSSSALAIAHDNYRAAVLAIIPHRLAVKLADLHSADVVRSVKRAAEEAGPEIHQAVFPNGMTPITKPYGRAEVEGLRLLEGRIAAATNWADRDAQLARVVAVRTKYEEVLQARQEAMLTAAAARAERDVAKEDLLDAFAEAAGAIQQIFPRDRARQDVFFDDLRRRVDDADDDDGDDPSDG
ncbi:MAG TPA: hypothetical protein VIL20_25900 [Sandaracinaceae bacterium]